MLMPKRVKFRKQHRGRRAGQATRGNKVDFGDYGLVSLEAGWITARQIEAARIAMTRYIRRGGKVWIRVFPDKPYTKKPLETRMGKGKGPVEGWVAVIKPGRVMFEMNGVAVDVAKEAMRLAMHKLPIKCKFVTRDGGPSAAATPAKAQTESAPALKPTVVEEVVEVIEAAVEPIDPPVAAIEEIETEAPGAEETASEEGAE